MLKVEKRLEEIITCIICMEISYDSVTCFNCSNLFCSTCIAKLFKYNNKCPMCRKVFNGFQNKVLDQRVQVIKEFILLNKKNLKLIEDCDYLCSTLTRMDIHSKNKDNFLVKIIALHEKIAQSEDDFMNNFEDLLEVSEDMLVIQERLKLTKKVLESNLQVYLKNMKKYLDLKKKVKKKVITSLEYNNEDHARVLVNVSYFTVIFLTFASVSAFLYFFNYLTGGLIAELPLFKYLTL